MLNESLAHNKALLHTGHTLMFLHKKISENIESQDVQE